MAEDVIVKPADPHGLGVDAAWHPQSAVSLGSHASGLLSKVYESVQQNGVTDQFTDALVSNSTGRRTDETTASLVQTGKDQVDTAVTAVNRAHGVSLEAQNVLNTKGGIAAQVAGMESEFTALQAEFSGKEDTPQNQAEYERRYQELRTKHGSEVQSIGANGKASSEAIIPQITAGKTPSVPSSMNPNVEGSPGIPTMPDGLMGQALQMVSGVAKAPGQLPIPQFGQFAQQGAQLTQAMVQEMAKQAKSGDSGEGSGLETTSSNGVPVTPAALSALNQAQRDVDQKATLSKADKDADGEKKDDSSGRAGSGAVKTAGAGHSAMPAAAAPETGNTAAAAAGGDDSAAKEGVAVKADGPEVTVPNSPGVSEVNPATATTSGGQDGAGVSQSGGHTTLSSAHDADSGQTTLSAAHSAGGGATTLSSSDVGGGAAASPTATTAAGAPAAGAAAGGGMGMGGMAPMMGAMGGHGQQGADGGGRRSIADPNAGGGAHRKRVSVSVVGVSGQQQGGPQIAAGLADSGSDLVGLEHATAQQYQAAGVVASLVRAHIRAGVLTDVAAGVCADGRVVFATSDGLGFVTPGVRVPYGAVPLATLVPAGFVDVWLGCGQPWRALQAAERQGLVDRFTAVASSDPDGEPEGVLAVSEEQMRAMNLPPAVVAWFDLDTVGVGSSADEVAAAVEGLADRWDPPGSVPARRLEAVAWSQRWTGEVDRGYAPLWVAYLIAAARTDLAVGDVRSARYLAACAARVPVRSLRPVGGGV